jgi:predicted nucleotidyltransferase
MEQKEALEIVGKYKKDLSRKMNFQEMIFFGSYAKGIPHEESDLDVAVIVSELDDDFFTKRMFMWKVRRSIDNRIEPVLLSSNNDESGFLETVRKAGIPVQ